MQTGHSVMLHVTDFLHYLYVAAPDSFTPQDCEKYKTFLESQITQHQPAIHSIQMVMRENLYGFSGNVQNPYLKITVTDPKFINEAQSKTEMRIGGGCGKVLEMVGLKHSTVFNMYCDS
jgi:DNA polymerase delta subunit 1